MSVILVLCGKCTHLQVFDNTEWQARLARSKARFHCEGYAHTVELIDGPVRFTYFPIHRSALVERTRSSDASEARR